MDTVALLQIISIAAFSLSGLLFIASVILFIKFRIPDIAGDLSGKTAKKQIQVIRNQNAEKGEHRYRPDAANIYKGKPSERLGNSSRLKRRNPTGETVDSGKLIIGRAMTERMRVDTDTNSEELVKPFIPQRTDKKSVETTLLIRTETAAATEVLDPCCRPSSFAATEKLTEQAADTPPGLNANSFQLIQNITLIHTDETI